MSWRGRSIHIRTFASTSITRRQMSDVTTSLFTLTGRQFSPDGAVQDIDGYGIMAGFERRISATTRVTALVGLEDADGAESNQSPEFVSTLTLRRNPRDD